MIPHVLLIAGGIGLFLVGMLVLTDGLKGLAGNALRRALARFTRSAASGAATGALATAVIQSSSATTVTAVGFVGAGLFTFPQALGVVFGANVGTTVTGWVVAIVGFKLQLGVVAMPLVLAGVLTRMFARGRLRHLGWGLAGFSLLFIGIDTMQQSMALFEGVITPRDFPADTFAGRLQLVLLGAAVTLITQSSSAGVATALVALHAGTISFAQAAAMVIGMHVGTTFTAALATIGGSAAMRQTGFAHVIHNLMSSVLAFLLLTPYTAIVAGSMAGGATGGDGSAQISLVAFHTIFSTLGVIVVIPFARPFARLVMRLIPERGPLLVRRLDDRLIPDPAAAADAAVATIGEITGELFAVLTRLLDPRAGRPVEPARLARVGSALETTRRFVDRMRTDPAQPVAHQRHLATIHALDHLARLHSRCTQTARIDALLDDPRLRELAATLRGAVAPLPPTTDLETAEQRLDRVRTRFRRQRGGHRERMVVAASTRRLDAETAVLRLDSVRWLHRVAYHAWRIVHHLRRGAGMMPLPPEADGQTLEVREDEA